MTGEAWLLVAVAAVAGYLVAKHGCGCDHKTPTANPLATLATPAAQPSDIRPDWFRMTNDHGHETYYYNDGTVAVRGIG